MVHLTRGSVLLAGASLLSSVAAVPTIEIKGSQFVNSKSGDRFQMIGVDYQPGGEAGYKPEDKKDPLSDADTCLRDATLLQRLGVNTVRIYNIATDINHDECMSIFNAAGIYLLFDVNSPKSGDHINRKDPKSTYNEDYLKRIFGMVEAFKDYPNLLGFFGANEIINEQSTKDIPVYIRAVQRDLKDYIDKHAERKIPVGYSAAHVEDLLVDTFNYVSCEDSDNPSSSSDFFGLNSYSWCGKSSYEKSGYNKLVDMFSNASAPVFFSEYGCNEVKPRVFTEVEALYGEKMTKAMCGGLVYEYTQEDHEYGLVEVKKDGSAKLLVDYDNLQGQFEKLDIKKLQSLDPSDAKIKPEKCDAKLIKGKKFTAKFDLPKLPKGGEKLLKDGVKATKGKIVKVKKTKVEAKVTDKDGKEIKGLELQVLKDDQTNVPGENKGKGSGTDSSEKPKPSAAAPKFAGAGIASIFAAATALTLLFV